MASSSLEAYASREGLVAAIQWIDSDTSYGLIKHWCRKAVERDAEGTLFLQGEDIVETVPTGHYVVLVGKHFVSLSPEEFEEAYVKVIAP